MSDRNEPVKGSSAPQLCANGCGFFGNAAFANMCSQCYKATHPAASSSPPREVSPLAAAAAAPPAAVSAPAPTAAAAPEVAPEAADGSGPAPMATAAPAAEAAAGAGAPDETPTKKKKKKSKRKRCHGCRKKVGLTGYTCRCGEVFCDTHRYADAHNCTFDYAADGRALLAKLNPKVVAAKLERL